MLPENPYTLYMYAVLNLETKELVIKKIINFPQTHKEINNSQMNKSYDRLCHSASRCGLSGFLS